MSITKPSGPCNLSEDLGGFWSVEVPKQAPQIFEDNIQHVAFHPFSSSPQKSPKAATSVSAKSVEWNEKKWYVRSTSITRNINHHEFNQNMSSTLNMWMPWLIEGLVEIPIECITGREGVSLPFWYTICRFRKPVDWVSSTRHIQTKTYGSVSGRCTDADG